MNDETYEKVTKDLDYFLQDIGCNQKECKDIKKMIFGYNVFESHLTMKMFVAEL